MSRLILILCALSFSSSALHAQSSPEAEVDLHFTKSGRLLLQITGKNLPDYLEWFPGQSQQGSYCVNVLRKEPFNTSLMLQTLTVDSSTESQVQAGGRDEVYVITKRDDEFAAFFNFVPEFDSEELTLSITLSFIGLEAAQANEIGLLCEFSVPILLLSRFTIMPGDRTWVDMSD